MKCLSRGIHAGWHVLARLFALSVVASLGFAPVSIAGHLSGTNALYTLTGDFAEA